MGKSGGVGTETRRVTTLLSGLSQAKCSNREGIVPLPRMDEFLDSLGDATIFTKLECNSGYWQIPFADENRNKTTFTSHSGCFRIKRMRFGLCNDPATFQRTLDILLSGLRWKSCLVYLDDIIIFSNFEYEHLEHIEKIRSILKKFRQPLKLNKCHFFTKTVEYLRHAVRPGILDVATENTQAQRGFEETATKTQLRSILGMCNLYRRFMPKFSRTAAPSRSYYENPRDRSSLRSTKPKATLSHCSRRRSHHRRSSNSRDAIWSIRLTPTRVTTSWDVPCLKCI